MTTSGWIFKQFKSDSQAAGVILEWYRQAASEAKAEFRVTLQFLNERSIEQWGTPRAKPKFRRLSNDLQGYCELRFLANKIQHRPIGRFTGKGEFTILVFAIEKGNNFVPKRQTLKGILANRSQLIRQNKERHTDEWKI